jgi:hypothetical protein
MNILGMDMCALQKFLFNFHFIIVVVVVVRVRGEFGVETEHT